MKTKDLTPEQAERFQACETYEDFMSLAGEVGLELDENEDEALRLLFKDPEAFAARMAQTSAEDEDADFTEDELKAVAGGADQRAWVPAIVDLCSPERARKIAMQYTDLYKW